MASNASDMPGVSDARTRLNMSCSTLDQGATDRRIRAIFCAPSEGQAKLRTGEQSLPSRARRPLRSRRRGQARDGRLWEAGRSPHELPPTGGRDFQVWDWFEAVAAEGEGCELGGAAATGLLRSGRGRLQGHGSRRSPYVGSGWPHRSLRPATGPAAALQGSRSGGGGHWRAGRWRTGGAPAPRRE